MTKSLKSIAFGIIVSAWAFSAHAEKLVESFNTYELDKFPKSFKTYPFQRGKAEQVYLVKEEGGNQFLHALDDKDLSAQAFKRFSWDVKSWPYFSFCSRGFRQCLW